MHVSSFQFLQKNYPELYQLAIQAERYAHSDHSSFLLKIRMFLEIWCHDVAYQHVKSVDIEPALFDKIEQLRLLSLISHETTATLHNLRAICNRGVHLAFEQSRGFCQVVEVSDNDINLCLSGIYQLAANIAGEQQSAPGAGLQLSAQAKLDAAVMQGFSGNGKASLNVVKLIHTDIKQRKAKSRYNETDVIYWLNKALTQGSFEALEYYSQLLVEKRYKQLDLKHLKYWLDEFKQLEQQADYALIAAKTYETLGEMRVAIKHYHVAAEQGCFTSLKRLQDYYIKRDDDAFFAVICLGNEHNERRSVYYFLMFHLFEFNFANHPEDAHKACLKKLKQQYLKAKAFNVEGLAYAEAVLGLYQTLNVHYSPQQAAEIIAQHWQKTPRYFKLDFAIFTKLLNEQIRAPFMVEFAQAIMPFCQESSLLAELELNLGLLQWQLSLEKTPFTAKQNSRELIKSSARRGNTDAQNMLTHLNGRFGKAAMPFHLPKFKGISKRQYANAL